MNHCDEREQQSNPEPAFRHTVIDSESIIAQIVIDFQKKERIVVSEEKKRYKGLELFIRVCAESATQEEAAKALGIDAVKFRGRFHTYNHRLKSLGFKPMEPLPSVPKSLQSALERLEEEGLITKQLSLLPED